MVNTMDEHNQEFDQAKFEALEEMTYATSHALETLINLMVDKGFFSEDELLKKMDDLAAHEDIEEVGHDADAPRDVEKDMDL